MLLFVYVTLVMTIYTRSLMMSSTIKADDDDADRLRGASSDTNALIKTFNYSEKNDIYIGTTLQLQRGSYKII